MDVLLEVNGVEVEIERRERPTIRPVDGLSFAVERGKCLGIVGESGCGKSMTLRAIMGLLPRGGRLVGGDCRIRGAQHDSLQPLVPRRSRGRDVAMVFQEPMSSLNPTKRVGDLVAEGIITHRRASGRSAARRRAVELMAEVGIPDPERRARAWPHELSGGLRQRVMIAMALSSEPSVILCDEPTTALDVTVQDQVLRLLDRLRRERGLAIVFVTHDLAVLSQIADDLLVMYAGRGAEYGPTLELLRRPLHPYTAGLIGSLVGGAGAERRDFRSIGGAPPDPAHFPPGCRFHPRCRYCQPECVEADALLRTVAPGRGSACILHERLADSAEPAEAML